MNINEIMTLNPILTSPDTSLKETAELMARDDIGFIPVGDENRLQGTLTDRDIVIRCVSKGKDAETTCIRDILTSKLHYCREDQSAGEVARIMSEKQVRRLPVLNKDNRLVGIVSLGDIARYLSADIAGKVLRKITSHHRSV